MADFSRQSRFLTVAAAALSLLALAATSHAGPSFIASSHVKEGNVYSEVSVQLRCNASTSATTRAARATFCASGSRLTTVCAGAPPTVALSREQHRPVAAETALLDSIEYDGQSPGGEYLRLNFLEAVSFDVVQDNRSNWITVRVFPEQVAEPVAAVAEPAPSRMVRRQDPPPPKYVINLESWERPPTTADMPVVATTKDKTVFVSKH